MVNIQLTQHGLRMVQRMLEEGRTPEEQYEILCRRYTELVEGGCNDFEKKEVIVSQVRSLVRLTEACPVCGSHECQDNVSWMGAHMFHASEHPENRAPNRTPPYTGGA